MMVTMVLSIAIGSAASADLPSLRSVPKIDEGLFVVGLADRIRKNCPAITARFFKAIGYLRDLEDEARALGYSEAEVERHLDSDIEKDRLRRRAVEYMNTRGYAQDQAGYCALGRAEIAQNSEIGALLRNRN